MELVIEDNSIINKKEILDLIPNIPFYWKDSTTSKKFPMYYHALVDRPINDYFFDETTDLSSRIMSEYFDYFKSIVDSFCKKYNISYKNIIRANINSTFNVPNYFFGDPHVDFSKEHIVLLMYLSKVSPESKTIIFNIYQNFDNKNTWIDISKYDPDYFPIKAEISPDFGKIDMFDGVFFHTNRHPKPGENRIVCVFKLLK